MSYEKQTFVDWELDESGNVVKEGTTLNAAHLQHIEEGIVANEQALENKQPKGNYLTEHQKLKTINGESLSGDGGFVIDALSDNGKRILIELLKKAVFTSDQSDAISSLEREFFPEGTEAEGVVKIGTVLKITHDVSAVQNGSTLAII